MSSTRGLSCGLSIGTPVRWAGRDWTVSGGRCGDDQPPEMRDRVFLERDRTPTGFTLVGVRASELHPMDLLEVLAEEGGGPDDSGE